MNSVLIIKSTFIMIVSTTVAVLLTTSACNGDYEEGFAYDTEYPATPSVIQGLKIFNDTYLQRGV